MPGIVAKDEDNVGFARRGGLERRSKQECRGEEGEEEFHGKQRKANEVNSRNQTWFRSAAKDHQLPLRRKQVCFRLEELNVRANR